MKRKILGVLLILILGLSLTGCDDEKVYIIAFDSSGGSVVEFQKVKEGSFAVKPEDPTKEGYVFEYWQYNGAEYLFNTTVVHDIVLTATWKSLDSLNGHYVTFDTDGGTKMYDSFVGNGETLSRPIDPVKEGYAFKYWTLDGKVYDFDEPVTKDITLKAEWIVAGEVKSKYNVTFNPDNGEELTIVEVANGSKLTKPANPTKKGYVFLDWYNGNSIYNFSNVVTYDLILVAKWAKEGNYTITFDTDGADPIAKQIVAAGKTVTKPANPTKTGYNFVEWQLNGKKYDFATKVSSDMVLKAKWELPKYTVTFNTGGGTTIKPQTVYINNTVTKPANPTKAGHTFVNWVSNGEVYDFSTPVTSNITITAVWEINTYTVTFDSAGGSPVEAQTVNYNGKATQPANPTKDGSTFNGWLLNGKPYSFSSAVVKDITLVASWKENATKKYTFEAVKIDEFTFDYKIRIYEDGTEIDFKSNINEVKYTDGTHLCWGTDRAVGEIDIINETKIILVFKNGQQVTANKK